MFHDGLMDANEFERLHDLYRRLGDTVDMSLRKFLEVVKEAQAAFYRTGKDIHVTALMLMLDFAEAIDGVTILISKGSARNCPQLLRTAFEIMMSLRYILDDADKYEQRSLAYEYFHLQDALRWVQRFDAQDDLCKRLKQELEGEEAADVFDTPAGVDIATEIDKWKRCVSSDRYAMVREEIERMTELKRSKRRGAAPEKWFNLWNGPSHLRDLAARLKLLTLYEVFYRSWSKVTHGNAAIKRGLLPAGEGVVKHDPIRSPRGLQGRCTDACVLTQLLTWALIERVVPRLKEEYKVWWRGKMEPALGFANGVERRG